MSQCEVCGKSPAAPIKLKRNVGLVVVHRTVTARAVLCANCAEEVTREFQRQTLTKGWTSPRSALFNPATMAGNAIRKRRHERRIQDQLTLQTPVSPVGNSLSDSDDPSDLLVAFGRFDVATMRTVLDLILDFQGGGLLSTPETVEIARKVPSQPAQQEMGDIAKSVLEGLEAAAGNQTFEGLVHGILVTGLWELLEMTPDDASDSHQHLSGAMLDAAAQLLKIGRSDDALRVLLVGQLLYANLAPWLQARAK